LDKKLSDVYLHAFEAGFVAGVLKAVLTPEIDGKQ